ncbi:MAG: hypothetical protein UV60_C0014G0011 [Parcubacteria group bacterium GW2011_GWA2_43_11]|nr:MAG: hypothetical protein UV60_C0014G0011 [Parcubacteria group bacterium GW2011_GWA2_43_11]
MLKLESILRTEETKLYKTLSLTGKVLDLGGVKNSEYLKLAQGDFVVTSVNFDASTGCDVLHNLEQTPIPFPDSSYDAVVLLRQVIIGGLPKSQYEKCLKTTVCLKYISNHLELEFSQFAFILLSDYFLSHLGCLRTC